MELKNTAIVEKLVESIDYRKTRLHESIAGFPVSAEEYQDLPVKERMRTAEKVLRGLADVSAESKWGEARQTQARQIPLLSARTDVALSARVGYDQGRWINAMNDTHWSKFPGLWVYVRATDLATGINAEPVFFGELEFGPYKVDDGSRYGKWIQEDHVNVGKATYPLKAEESQDVIGIIDEVVCGLIESEVARRRGLGAAALTETQNMT